MASKLDQAKIVVLPVFGSRTERLKWIRAQPPEVRKQIKLQGCSLGAIRARETRAKRKQDAAAAK
jgi:hypothetical protein